MFTIESLQKALIALGLLNASQASIGEWCLSTEQAYRTACENDGHHFALCSQPANIEQCTVSVRNIILNGAPVAETTNQPPAPQAPAPQAPPLPETSPVPTAKVVDGEDGEDDKLDEDDAGDKDGDADNTEVDDN